MYRVSAFGSRTWHSVTYDANEARGNHELKGETQQIPGTVFRCSRT